ncbi:TPM domain protein [anaerobic digester metagenome]
MLVVNSTLPRSANEFALRTFQMNEIGKEGKDNGVLILIVASTREWKVEVGYGLEGVITPTFLNQVATDYVVPYLEDDDYGEGVYNMALFIGTEIMDKYEGSESGDPAFPIGWVPLTTLQWVLLIIGLVAITIITKGRIWLLLFFVLTLGRGGGGFGGGRSGGGGGGGRF